jgi:hypothetical protein
MSRRHLFWWWLFWSVKRADTPGNNMTRTWHDYFDPSNYAGSDFGSSDVALVRGRIIQIYCNQQFCNFNKPCLLDSQFKSFFNWTLFRVNLVRHLWLQHINRCVGVTVISLSGLTTLQRKSSNKLYKPRKHNTMTFLKPTPKRTSSGLHSPAQTPKWVCDRCGITIDKRKYSYDESADGSEEKCGGGCDHAEQTLRVVDNWAKNEIIILFVVWVVNIKYQ